MLESLKSWNYLFENEKCWIKRVHLLNMNDVECDGRRIEPHKDPPGQKCVYIVPGKLGFVCKVVVLL